MLCTLLSETYNRQIAWIPVTNPLWPQFAKLKVKNGPCIIAPFQQNCPPRKTSIGYKLLGYNPTLWLGPFITPLSRNTVVYD